MGHAIPKRWVLASGNAGKLAEMRALLAHLDIELISQRAFDVPDADETGIGFVDNALIKARHAAEHTGLPAIADDSGLAVAALGGAPGVYSARYAGKHGDDAANNQLLLDNLSGVAAGQRQAAFHCCLAATLTATDPVPLIAHGQWHGTILREPVGEAGFGYDPLFWVAVENASAASMPAERKNAISHRAIAMRRLVEQMAARG